MISFISFVLIVFVLIYYYRRRRQSLFSKQDIRGPPPNFLFGNLVEYIKTPFYELFTKWNKEYGKIFCYYEGPTPNLVIGDPDLLQEILVKQFSNFHGRKLFPIQSDPDKDERINMFMARGKRWKRLRTTINPAFSDSKMRRMFPLIDESIKCFILKIKENVKEDLSGNSSEVEIQELLQRMTMDIICKCAFGIDTNCQTNVKHPFIVSLKRFHKGLTFLGLKSLVFLSFPELKGLGLYLFKLMNRQRAKNDDLLIVRNKMIEVIEARKKCTEKRYDLLQLLLESEVPGTKLLDEDNLCPFNDTISKCDQQTDENKTDENDQEKKPPKFKSNAKPLTTEEIISQANLFLFAGYETSSTALSFITYLLSTHRHVQERLQLEIDSIFEATDSNKFESLDFYDAITKLPYLNAVIYEALRFYPFTSNIFNRLCLKSEGTYLSNGLYIPKDVNIIPNLYALHFDCEIWNTVDPQTFAPERFLQTNEGNVEFIGPPHPFAWLPFGGGPRNCIGQRFAMMVIKATLVRFVRDYHVNTSSKTEIPLKLKVAAVMSPMNGVHIGISKRNHGNY